MKRRMSSTRRLGGWPAGQQWAEVQVAADRSLTFAIGSPKYQCSSWSTCQVLRAGNVCC